MGAPYVSIRRLVGNSQSAMLSAVEIYNKPRVAYREEITTILVVNAWELALKAALRQDKQRIHYKKQPRAPYRSIGIDDALGRVSARGLWPKSVDGSSVTANIQALTEYRDRAIHLYNVEDLGSVIYPFLQQNIINYRDFMVEKFKKDLAASMTWQLLPLGASVPAESIQFMRSDKAARSGAEVQKFMDNLRDLVARAEAADSDLSRIAATYDINLQSVKHVTSTDLSVAVTPAAKGKMAVKKTDSNQTHPFSATELIAKVNEKRRGRELNAHDHKVLCWKEGLRDEPQYAWKHRNAPAHVWSGDALSYMVSIPDHRYDEMRVEYAAVHARGKR